MYVGMITHLYDFPCNGETLWEVMAADNYLRGEGSVIKHTHPHPIHSHTHLCSNLHTNMRVAE